MVGRHASPTDRNPACTVTASTCCPARSAGNGRRRPGGPGPWTATSPPTSASAPTRARRSSRSARATPRSRDPAGPPDARLLARRAHRHRAHRRGRDRHLPGAPAPSGALPSGVDGLDLAVTGAGSPRSRPTRVATRRPSTAPTSCTAPACGPIRTSPSRSPRRRPSATRVDRSRCCPPTPTTTRTRPPTPSTVTVSPGTNLTLTTAGRRAQPRRPAANYAVPVTLGGVRGDLPAVVLTLAGGADLRRRPARLHPALRHPAALRRPGRRRPHAAAWSPTTPRTPPTSPSPRPRAATSSSSAPATSHGRRCGRRTTSRSAS